MLKSKSFSLSCALALGLLAAFLFAVLPMTAQARLAQKMTRLHIIANSDSVADQQLKLKVRDRVLEYTGSLAVDENVISDELLGDIQKAAQDEVHAQGFDYDVKIEKTRMFFETKEYDGFSLPAGYYDAVRVLIGKAEGQNWWCVIFPPLCAGACEGDITEIAKSSGLSDDEIAYITEDGTHYVIRFKIVESLSNFFGKKN